MRLILIILVLFAGCKTQKTTSKTATESQIQKAEFAKKASNLDLDFLESEIEYKLNSFGYGYNFSLSSKDSTPARIVEYREGKPYRALEVNNGTYTENTAVKDSSVLDKYKELQQKYNTLEVLYSRQNKQLKQLIQEQKQTKIEGKKLANNFKYALWLLLAIALIWIGQSTGLFVLIKHLFKLY